MGIVVVAALAAQRRRRRSGRGDHGDPSANQFGRQRRQSIDLILGPAVFDRHVLALDIAGVLQALAKCAQTVRDGSGDVGSRNPITGIAGCCARAASGHAAAAPPSSVMNSRRFIRSIASDASSRRGSIADWRASSQGPAALRISTPLMSATGQKHELPHRSIAVRFAPNQQTPTRRVRCDAMCHKATYAPQQRTVAIRSPRRRGRAASAELSRPSALAVLRLMTNSNLVDCMHRQVRGLLALEDAAGVDAGLTIRVRNAGAVAHQTAGFGIFANCVDRRDRVARRQRDKLFAPGDEECIGATTVRRLAAGQASQRPCRFRAGAGVEDIETAAQVARRRLHVFR